MGRKDEEGGPGTQKGGGMGGRRQGDGAERTAEMSVEKCAFSPPPLPTTYTERSPTVWGRGLLGERRERDREERQLAELKYAPFV